MGNVLHVDALQTSQFLLGCVTPLLSADLQDFACADMSGKVYWRVA